MQTYTFKCNKCKKDIELYMTIGEYLEQRDTFKCDCGNLLDRTYPQDSTFISCMKNQYNPKTHRSNTWKM